MKILILASSLDLTQPFSATPAWWQLMKGLYEIGADVLAAPYQGPAIETLWWRAVPNPAKTQGDLFKFGRDRLRGILPKKKTSAQKPVVQADIEESGMDRLMRTAAQKMIAPLWQRQLDETLQREPDIDAIIILTAPLNHLVGLAQYIQDQHHKPVFYYDGDVPASLPDMQGFASGFRIYQGANLKEYTAFISNSLGGAEKIRELGAHAVHTLYYGADPTVFSAVAVDRQDIDLMFYGHGREYREIWVDAMLANPSRKMTDSRFAVRGKNLGDLGPTEMLPYLSFSKLREYACRSKINLCITRAAHANVFASSSSRPFELASMGCCIVGNPYLGVETWFEPEREIIIVHSEEEALERYQYLLNHEAERLKIGQSARERVLKEHTFQHRARELVGIIQGYL